MAEMNLLVPQNNGLTLNPDIECALIGYAEAAKKAKADYDDFIARVQAAMEEEGLVKLETPSVRVNYIPEGEREKFDSKALRAELPDVYDNYCTLTKVKASVRVTIK